MKQVNIMNQGIEEQYILALPREVPKLKNLWSKTSVSHP